MLGFPSSRTAFVAKVVTDWDNNLQPGGSVEAALNQLAKRLKAMENVANEILTQSEVILVELRITNKHLALLTEADIDESQLEHGDDK